MIESSVLSSGIRLVTETMPEVRSSCIGFWVGTGSRDETPAQSGISHFLEHLLFKGTPNRSARTIAEDIDAVGGDMNAFTTKEYTTFYVRTLSDDTPLALRILTDIMTDPAFRPDEVDAERQVILEEVLMHLDEPSDVVQERFAEAVFAGHPLGREVLGTKEVIESVTVAEIREFFDFHYGPANIVVAAAGDVSHDDLAVEIDRHFSHLSPGGPPIRVAPDSPSRRLDVLTRDSEQAHLVIGCKAPARRSPHRFALSLVNHTLGGGLSSRLFQKVREERGLAYSIVSDRVAYDDAGYLAVSVGTAPERTDEVLSIVREELDLLSRDGISDKELALAKGHLVADTLLSLEDSGARMSRIGSSLLLHGEVLETEEIISRVRAVTAEEAGEIAHNVLSNDNILAVVGPFESQDFSSWSQ